MPLSLSPARLASRHAALPLALLLVLGQARADITVEERSLSTPAVKTAAAPASTATEKVTVSPGVATVSQDSNSWDSYNQLQQLQQQIEQMQGQLEQQGHLIDKLQADLRARYTDLDQRLNAQQEQLKSATPAAPAAAATTDAAPASSTIEEEKKAYLAAYETFRAGGPDKAIPPMLAFVKRYPNSSFAPNAYYWLGEFYLNASTPDQASAQKHFDTVLAKYPDNAKAPAALYKIGSILDLQGKPQEAKKKMQELLAKYPKAPEAGLADSYLKALEAASAPAPKPAAAKPAAEKPAAAKKATAKKG